MNNRPRLATCLFFPLLLSFVLPLGLAAQSAPKSVNKQVLDSLFALSAIKLAAIAPAPDSVPNPENLSNEAVMYLAFSLADQAVNLENYFIQNAHRATLSRQLREKELEVMKNDTLAEKDEIDALKGTIKELKLAEKQTAKQLKEASKIADMAVKTVQKDTAEVRKALPKIRERVAWLTEQAEGKPAAPPSSPAIVTNEPPITPEQSAPTPSETPQPTPADSKPSKQPGKKFARYSPETDVMLHPPTPPCAFAANGRDEFSGETRRETQREELFRFTNDFMKPYLKDVPHILCEANLVTAGTLTTLVLTFTINDQNARRAFGSIAQGSRATLKLIDGSTFNLMNLRGDDGQTDDSGRVTVYRAQYGLDRSLVKRLTDSELDKIRISWSKGHEDYEIYNVDLLKRQIRCLENG